MKKLSLLLAFTVLIILFTSCASKEYENFHELGNGVGLQRENITYSFYSALPSDLKAGKQIGIIDNDKKHKVFELKGFSSEEWVVEYYDVIMSVYSVYKAETVTEIPSELASVNIAIQPDESGDEDATEPGDRTEIEVSADVIGDVEYTGDNDSDTSGVTDELSAAVSGNDKGSLVVMLSGTAFDLDKQIEYNFLVNLTADELAILRNAIYARHGYIFKNAKYTEYFSDFDWYVPAKEDVSSSFTNEDKTNIVLIQKVEGFYDKSAKLSDDEKNMVGAWHLGAGVGSGYSDMYRFYDDGTYKYNLSQMVMDRRDLSHGGKWFILDGFLYLRAEREGVLEGGELVDAENPSSASEKEIIDAEYTVKPLETYKAYKLKIDYDSGIIERDYGYQGAVIGSMDFYKLSPDPDDFGGDLYDV